MKCTNPGVRLGLSCTTQEANDLNELFQKREVLPLKLGKYKIGYFYPTSIETNCSSREPIFIDLRLTKVVTLGDLE